MPIYIDPSSFGIGIVTGILFWILYNRFRATFKDWRAGLFVKGEEMQTHHSNKVEENHRRITLQRAQGMHLAAPLFALDDVLVPPLLIAPPPHVEPGGPVPAEDIVATTLPYLPAWPELATYYRAPSLSISQALSAGRNIVVIGMNGIGKTVVLAHLASLVARGDPQLGDLSESIPFLIHVADLSLPERGPKVILDQVIEATAERTTFLEREQFSSFVQHSFKYGRALLLLDGYDELTQEGQQAVVDFLNILQQTYPKSRIVATALPEQIGGLITLGFSPLALMGWDFHRQKEFLTRWSEQWEHLSMGDTWIQSEVESNTPILQNSWLFHGSQNLTPFELTLKAWGAYAGDSQGPGAVDAIESHIQRLTPINSPIAPLETLATQVILKMEPIFDARKARAWIGSLETDEENPDDEQPTVGGGDQQITSVLTRRKNPGALFWLTSVLTGKMSRSGLLQTHHNNQIRFFHPIFSGYLAGRSLSVFKTEQALLDQPNWGGKLLALHYLAAYGDATNLVDESLKIEDPILERPVLNAARWLRDAPPDAAWRGKILSKLANILQGENKPHGLRGQALTAIAFSGDGGAPALIRQILQSMSPETIPLLALGIGVIRDGKSMELLSTAMSLPGITVKRAVCLALVAIGSQPALEAVAHTLLSGDDELRRAAAEALANNPDEGYAMLKDGATIKDVHVRRAVVYGLSRVDEPWAIEILQRLQLEDDQWIVRTAATEVLNNISLASEPRPPVLITPPSETPWLIEFAGKYGLGIPQNVPATELLIKALKDDNTEVRIGAMQRLRFTPTENVVKSLYEPLYGYDMKLREAAFQTIWELASGGVSLPNPAQMGFV